MANTTNYHRSINVDLYYYYRYISAYRRIDFKE